MVPCIEKIGRDRQNRAWQQTWSSLELWSRAEQLQPSWERGLEVWGGEENTTGRRASQQHTEEKYLSGVVV